MSVIWFLSGASGSMVVNSHTRFKHRSVKTAFGIVGTLMAAATILQISLISQREWSSLFSHASDLGEKLVAPARHWSFSIRKAASSRRPSVPSLCPLSTANLRNGAGTTDTIMKINTKNKHM